MEALSSQGDLDIMTLSRRGFLFGIGATLAVIRTPGLIMPVKAFEVPLEEPLWLTQYKIRQLADLMSRQNLGGDYIVRMHPETYQIFTEALEPGWKYAGVVVEGPVTEKQNSLNVSGPDTRFR